VNAVEGVFADGRRAADWSEERHGVKLK
jgi:hypothetical protein